MNEYQAKLPTPNNTAILVVSNLLDKVYKVVAGSILTGC